MNKNKRIKMIFGVLLLVSILILFSPNVLAADIEGWNTSSCPECKEEGGLLYFNSGGWITTSYSFDLLAGANYTFSYTVVSMDVGCDPYSFTLDIAPFNVSAYCLSTDSFTTQNCFDFLTHFYGGQNVQNSVTLSIPAANNNSINGVYYKDVKLVIYAGNCNAVLSNLSLREEKAIVDDIDYDYSSVPTTALTDESSCCPNDYCWNGTMCVSHTRWLDSDIPGIWNSPDGTKGYRCVLNDTGANWVFSEKKYDWDYQDSGYCQKNTDCFVDSNYVSNGVNDCISNDSFIKDIDDVTTDDDGNHYCHEGTWTTKTHLVAQLLIDFSKENPYVLHCYNNSDVTFNNWLIAYSGSDSSDIASCVLIKQDSEDELNDQVITGIITKDGSDDLLLTGLENDYAQTFRGMNPEVELNLDDCTATDPVIGNFHECFVGANSKTPLYIYYENHYKYFILSESTIDGLTPPTFWQTIINFFKNLFSGPNAPSVNPFDNMPLSNYDNIYLVSNEYGTVTAVEEMKYNSDKEKILNVLYVDYNCSNNNYNVINLNDIMKYVNDTLSANGLEDVTNDDITYDDNNNIQRVSITTEINTGLWPYLTSTSRHRGPAFECR
ncbi:MAG: hypothetical protein ACP5N1_00325 [Candidatus Woesearchaeota archaeon]